MNIIEATKSYEAWLAGLIPLIREDLLFKHQEMRRNLFSFLRATYYRWAQVWAGNCPELAHDTTVLAVGDLHVENFGTWRDLDGRLVWGVNDFDECYPLPFTNDLVRLAVSAWLAIDAGEMIIAARDGLRGDSQRATATASPPVASHLCWWTKARPCAPWPARV